METGKRDNKGQFKKGFSGKPKGVKHKKTLQWESLGEAIIGKQADKFNEELNKLEGKDFIQAYTSVLEYFKPKLQRTELKSENRHAFESDPFKKIRDNAELDEPNEEATESN